VIKRHIRLIIIKKHSLTLQVNIFTFTMEYYKFCFLYIDSHFITFEPRCLFFEFNDNLVNEQGEIFARHVALGVIREQQRL
jgi:hypothetical protein